MPRGRQVRALNPGERELFNTDTKHTNSDNHRGIHFNVCVSGQEGAAFLTKRKETEVDPSLVSLPGREQLSP